MLSDMASIATTVNGHGSSHDGPIKGLSELATFDNVFAALQENLASVFPGKSEISDALKWFKTVRLD